MTKGIIIGGGIGGLCAAIALRQAGIEVEVYERAPEMREVGAGIALWSNAIKALDQLGVGAHIRTLSDHPMSGGFHTARGGDLSTISAGEIIERFGAPTLVVHRADLQSALTRAVDVPIHTGVACLGFEQTEREVIVRFDKGHETRGDFLVGSDGIRSVVRGQLFPASKPRYAGYTAWRGITSFDHNRVNLWGESWGIGARFGIAPVGRDRIYWFATANMPEGTHIAPAVTKTRLLEIFGGWHAPIAELIAATGTILHNDIYDIDPLKRWTVGRVTLLGDAAHAMTPNLGQGACQAIEDAVVLGKCLRGAGDIPAALEQYERQRVPRTSTIARTSRMLGSIGQIANPLLCTLRDRAMRAVPRQVRMRQFDELLGYNV